MARRTLSPGGTATFDEWPEPDSGFAGNGPAADLTGGAGAGAGRGVVAWMPGVTETGWPGLPPVRMDRMGNGDSEGPGNR